MKRGAEKQLSKNDHSDGEIQDDALQIGFKKADESVLATRKIRALPKRASVAAIPLPTTQAPSSNFPSNNRGSSSFSGFSRVAPISSSTPVQTNTAKSLSSLLSSNSTVKSPNPTSMLSSASILAAPPTTSSLASNPPASMEEDDPSFSIEFDYFKNLRGLNESLRSAVHKAVESDPFADLNSVFEQYKNYRVNIQREHDTKMSSLSSTTTSAPSMPAEKNTPSDGLSSEEVKAAISTDTKPSATSSSGSIQPEANQSDGPISLVSNSVNTTTGSKPVDTTSTFSIFGTKQHETSKDSSLASSTPSLLPKQPDSKSSTSVPLALTGSTKPETKPTSVFGSSSLIFGSGSSPSFGSTASIKPGGASAPASGGRFAGFTGFGTFPKPTTSSAGFGLESSTTTASPFGLNLARTSSTLTATASNSSANGEIAGTAAAIEPSNADAEVSSDAPQTTAESFVLDQHNKHDQEGAGEENEETIYSAKLKAYVMKDGEGGKSWVELGYGVMRIKKHKETQARRVLLRSSSTGQILINFNIHSAFKPTQKGKNVTFLGHDAESTSKMYTVKLQTQEQATELADTFTREIQGGNASSS